MEGVTHAPSHADSQDVLSARGQGQVIEDDDDEDVVILQLSPAQLKYVEEVKRQCADSGRSPQIFHAPDIVKQLWENPFSPDPFFVRSVFVHRPLVDYDTKIRCPEHNTVLTGNGWAPPQLVQGEGM